jgi:hypothetical protein
MTQEIVYTGKHYQVNKVVNQNPYLFDRDWNAKDVGKPVYFAFVKPPDHKRGGLYFKTLKAATTWVKESELDK